MVSTDYKFMKKLLLKIVRQRLEWARGWHLKGFPHYATGNIDAAYDSINDFEGRVLGFSGRNFQEDLDDYRYCHRLQSRLKKAIGHFIDNLTEEPVRSIA